LDIVVERVRDLKVLLIVTFRPEFDPPWAGQSRVTMLALNRLDRRDRISLVAQVAGKALPDAVIDQIAERTDGVPLFVEEVTKSVLESGLLRAEPDRYVIDGILPPPAIPTSLYASLLARLDRQKSARLAAQIGATIGREFTYGLLQAVWALSDDELQTAVARLVASGLVYQRGAPPDAVYSFKHALVRDAAYGSLLRGRRRKFHALIAAALQSQAAELTESQPELFAWHFAEAGLAEESVAFWAKAGQRSAARSALAEAAAQFQKGLDQLALLPPTPERLRQRLEFCSALGAALRAVKGLAASETGQTYSQALDLWEQLGSPSEFVEIPFGLSRYYAYRGEVDSALRLDQRLLQLSRQRNDSVGLVLGHLSSGRNLMYAGRLESSRSHLEDLLAVADPAFHRSVVNRVGFFPQGNAQACLAVVLLCLGYPDQALAQSKAAIAAARDLAHVHSLISILALGALPLSLVGDPVLLGEWADELVAITTDQGFPAWWAIGTTYRGWVKVRHGDLAEGVLLLRSGTAAFRVTGSELFAPFLVILLASACAIAGQPEESLTLVAETLQIVERTGERWLAAELNRQKGELLLRQGNAAAAEELYGKALTIAADQGAKFWQLRAATSLARLRREQGRNVEAHAVLAPVYGWFTEGFNTVDLNEAKALLDGLDQDHAAGAALQDSA
jgi:tetratricopeptide (TPR) repeat protein